MLFLSVILQWTRGCFHFWLIVSNTAVHAGVQVSLLSHRDDFT